MRDTIWKFPIAEALRFDGLEHTVWMPSGAQVLGAGLQENEVVVWVRVDGDAPATARTFAVYGTGYPIRQKRVHHYATFQAGALVYHVFEVLDYVTGLQS